MTKVMKMRLMQLIDLLGRDTKLMSGDVGKVN